MPKSANAKKVERVPQRTLRLLSYNIQIGIKTRRYGQYLTHSWKHVLHHPQRFDNLDRIAQLMSEYDVVGVEEAVRTVLVAGEVVLDDGRTTRFDLSEAAATCAERFTATAYPAEAAALAERLRPHLEAYYRDWPHPQADPYAAYNSRR